MKLMITIFHLLTSFFYNYIGADYPIDVDSVDNFEAVQYYFFTNFYSRNYLYDIQVLLRFSLKMEYTYTEYILPLDLIYLQQRAEQLEAERKKQFEDAQRK